MVSFSCENCGDVLTKKKLDPHRNQCRGASYTCLDCMVHFHGTEYRTHTSCMSEAQKYQGNLYKEKKGKKTPFPHANGINSATAVSNNKENVGIQSDKNNISNSLVPRHTYIEETHTTNTVAIVDAPPEAPEPPRNINVFDFLVKDGGEDDGWESERDDDDDMRPEKYAQYQAYVEDGYAYGSTPVPATLHKIDSHAELKKNKTETPAIKNGHSRKISIDSTSAKKSGKRKRGHPEGLDLSKGDVDMADVPVNLHSGLTGGINRLLSTARGLPPSPELSGDANSPQSPLKRSKRDRDPSSRREKKSRRKSDSDHEETKRKKSSSNAKDVIRRDRSGNAIIERRRTRKRSPSPSGLNSSPNARHSKKQMKAIEYPGHSSDVNGEDTSRALVRTNTTVVEHAPTTKSVDMFLTCLARGSETDQGVSLWKALKRWRRDGGSGEKELWKELKIRANKDGDLVLCI